MCTAKRLVLGPSAPAHSREQYMLLLLPKYRDSCVVSGTAGSLGRRTRALVGRILLEQLEQRVLESCGHNHAYFGVHVAYGGVLYDVDNLKTWLLAGVVPDNHVDRCSASTGAVPVLQRIPL